MTKVERLIEQLKSFLKGAEKESIYKTSSKAFSRKGKLGFEKVALLNISLMKGNLSSELYNRLTMNGITSVSDSGYSQARYKIGANFFQSWNECMLREIYEGEKASTKEEEVQKWKGYYIEAIDGTKLVLPPTKLLGDYFGRYKSGTKHKVVETVMALLLCRYDVLNHYVTQSEVASIYTGEISVAKTWIQGLNSQSITLFDRGFSSFSMFYSLLKYEKPFVMRLKVGFNNEVKAFMASSSTDSLVTFTAGKEELIEYNNESQDHIKRGQSVLLRLVKVLLPNGKMELLATSFLEATCMSIAELATLYHMRWGIETCYDRLKNHLLIMCFSGLKPLAILQDIYATIFTHNLQQVFVQQAQITLNQQQKPQNKHLYAVNNVTAYAILKPNLIKIFLQLQPNNIIKQLIITMAINKDAMRPHKPPPPRIKTIAKRRNLVTQLNFKRTA